MPGTYTTLLYHIVFSTKGRRLMIKPELRPRIHEYLGGIVRSEGGTALRIGGMPDHIHLLIQWRADESLSTLMRQLKSNSTRWIRETLPGMESFAWQEGYSAFTVSVSQCEAVSRYIANQESHHRGQSFQDELVEMLVAHGVQYDARYLCD